LNELALFIGGGGGALGSKLIGHRIVCAVENDPYCQEIIMRRQEEGLLPAFPIWDDARSFDGKPWCGIVDLVTAGFPCQPWSLAGKRKGASDERNLWPDTFRIIQEVRPQYVMLENVPGIRKYLPVVIRDLRRAEYTVKRPLIVAAAAVGAGHIRKRVWIFAYDEEQCRGTVLHEKKESRRGQPRNCCSQEISPDDESEQVGVSGQPRKGSEGVPEKIPPDNESIGRQTLRSEQEQSREAGWNSSGSFDKISPDDFSLRQRKQPRGRTGTDRPYSTIGEDATQTELFADNEYSGLPQRQSKSGYYEQECQAIERDGCRRCSWWDSEPGLARLVCRYSSGLVIP